MEYTLKKSLGQHFLKDEMVCRQIYASLLEDTFSNLLEVGPGGGAITKYLLQVNSINFKAVELDGEKIAYLEKTYPAIKGKILHEDVLVMSAPFGERFAVIGNFPYNISSQILFRVLEWKERVTLVIGMFQKEVAERIASGPGKKMYGILSVLVQAFYTVEYLLDVQPECFTPPPKVESGVIRLRVREKSAEMRSEKDLFLLVKAAFNQRRKMLRNAVKHLFGPEVLADPLFNKRAEQLSVADFAALTFKMN